MDAVRQMKSATDGGADVSFEVARIDATYNGAISNVKRDGTVVVVSVFEGTVETNPNDIVMAEWVVRGTMSYLTSNYSGDEFRAVAEMMANG
jgi:(R,R)-butanediol dehydrogenase/meso-butanediol dehydrogenase/diacetyl reductase